NLNHLGFRMATAAELVECQRRLEIAGIKTQREEGVECCYAKQTKFWVHDPDGNLWEVYTFDGDLEHRGAGQLPEKVLQPAGQSTLAHANPADLKSASTPAAAIWTHRLGQPIAANLPLLNSTVDRAFLQGSL